MCQTLASCCLVVCPVIFFACFIGYVNLYLLICECKVYGGIAALGTTRLQFPCYKVPMAIQCS